MPVQVALPGRPRGDATAMDAERVRMSLAALLTSATPSDFMDVEVEARLVREKSNRPKLLATVAAWKVS